jgi:hypothetical protein
VSLYKLINKKILNEYLKEIRRISYQQIEEGIDEPGPIAQILSALEIIVKDMPEDVKEKVTMTFSEENL